MFHPPAAIGLALLPMAWAASDSAAHGRSAGAARRAADEDLARYFPAGWQRESLPDFPAAAAPLIQRLLQKLFRNVLRDVLQRVRAKWPARRGLPRG